MKYSFAALAVLLASTLVSAQMTAPGSGPLTRHYRDGITLTYHMTATNEEWHYTADASGTTKKTASGSYIEDFRWIGMTSNGQPITLAAEMAQFRQPLSLDPNWTPSMPDLSKVDSVGFADLMPGSGHGPGGYINIGRIEVYGNPVKR